MEEQARERSSCLRAHLEDVGRFSSRSQTSPRLNEGSPALALVARDPDLTQKETNALPPRCQPGAGAGPARRRAGAAAGVADDADDARRRRARRRRHGRPRRADAGPGR
eukprot:2620829-Prymnesium_polylepis.1